VNLVLLQDEDFALDGSVRLTGRRLEHIRTVLRLQVGATLRVGRLHGALGTARVFAVSKDEALLAALERGDGYFESFRRVAIEAPTIAVDTSDGYEPALDEIVAFVEGP
jgi:16S rRNA U1498 N3-methylase RsmE